MSSGTTLLFFDDWCLESSHNIVRRLGKPMWRREATLEDELTAGIYNFPLVFREEGTGSWKALYQGIVDGEHPLLMLAESDDGIAWRKPDLTDKLAQDDRRAVNQVLKGERVWDRCPVFHDTEEADPNRRLKTLFVRLDPDTGTRIGGIACSPDGLRWETEDRNWSGDCPDSPYNIFYHRRLNRYIISTRFSVGERRVGFIETADFQTFGSPRLVMHPDPLDPPLVNFYGMSVFPYEDMYVGLLWMFHVDPGEIGRVKRLGPIDAQLVYSYDGLTFNRTYRTPFIPRNERGEHGGGCIYPSSMLIDGQEAIRFYSGASRGEHYLDLDQKDAALLLHTLRLDGFMYLESYSHRGTVMTKPIRMDDNRLKLNVKAPYGSVRVQISDLLGVPLAGFSFDDCASFRGDSLRFEPVWKGGQLSDADRQAKLRLEIELTNAELYAIRGNFNLAGVE